MNALKLLILIQFLFAGMCFSQDHEELARRNGFKDIKLGSSIDSVKGTIFKKDGFELKEFPIRIYEVEHPNYSNVGDVPVTQVELKVYKGLIYEIIVITDMDPRIMRGLEKSYGKATYSIRTESFYWRAPHLLSLTYKGSRKEIKLTYRSMPMAKVMYADKHKKIDEVAEDF